MKIFFCFCCLILVLVAEDIPLRMESSSAKSASFASFRLLVCEGSSATIGHQIAKVWRTEGLPLLGVMAPVILQHSMQGSAEPLETRKARILPRHRDEIEAIAQEWGVSSQLLWEVHLRLLSGCAFIVLAPTEKNPQKILRHMDFEFPEVLGPASVVLVRRTKECKATVTVTWPGFAGVISGMNEDGLVVAFNASFAQDFPSSGMPVLFKTREILEEAKDIAEAETIFRRGSGVSEPHFVCVADGQKALVLWRNAEGVQRKELKPPVDCWTNDIDSRTNYVLGMCKNEKNLLAVFHQAAFQKRLFETCAQPSANVQSMVFESATRSLSLALAKKKVPAWTSEWATCRLAPALSGPMPATLAFLR